MSCAMTLGHKHNSTCTEMFKKRGPSLLTHQFNNDQKICFENKPKLSIVYRKWNTSETICNPFRKL